MSNIENLKKSIQTILAQFPKYETKFEPSERKLVNEFLAVINNFEEADNKRGILINRFNKYSENMMKTKDYFSTPFLWYTASVARQAIINLNISRFHALEFYKFLLYQLRELYQLIKRGTKLSSYKYDHLQTKCEKADFILTSDEFEILKTTNSSIEDDKTQALSSKFIKRKMVENVAISNNYKREAEISRFCTLVGGKWWFLFRSSCFGLTRVFFHIHLENDIELKEIIDFNDPDNNLLGLSNVDQVVNSKNDYIGTLLVPSRDIENLHNYLKHCEQKSYIDLKEFAIIRERKRGTSFTLYKPDRGWQILPAKQRKNLIQNCTMKITEEGVANNPKINLNWSFTEYPYPMDIIELYCNSPDQFSYLELPFDRIKGETEQGFSIKEIGILKFLIQKKALEVGFTPWRLIHNYSVNTYCIKVPKIPLTKLNLFLNILPFSETYISSRHIYIRTRLSEKLLLMIKNDFKWIVFPILRVHTPTDMSVSWFEKENLDWIKPEVI